MDITGQLVIGVVITGFGAWMTMLHGRISKLMDDSNNRGIAVARLEEKMEFIYRALDRLDKMHEKMNEKQDQIIDALKAGGIERRDKR